MAIKRNQLSDKLPQMTREEEAQFWDKHSIFDFADDLEEVEVTFAKPLGHILSVRVDSATVRALEAIARPKGIGPSTLVRMWVLERLAQEPPPAAPETKPRRGSKRKSAGQAGAER
jgi:hypothetical protein